jgi:DnaJ-domain-containing protein 1
MRNSTRPVQQVPITVVRRAFRASAVVSKEDYYATLGVPKTASKSEIKKKYFELAKK